MLATAAAVPIGLAALQLTSNWVLLSLMALPFAAKPLRLVMKESGPVLNEALAGTAKLQLVYGLLLSVGLAQ
jgi:1,4-dihydroxy-2-naphthoate octaprenyltransferase